MKKIVFLNEEYFITLLFDLTAKAIFMSSSKEQISSIVAEAPKVQSPIPGLRPQYVVSGELFTCQAGAVSCAPQQIR